MIVYGDSKKVKILKISKFCSAPPWQRNAVLGQGVSGMKVLFYTLSAIKVQEMVEMSFIQKVEQKGEG